MWHQVGVRGGCACRPNSPAASPRLAAVPYARAFSWSKFISSGVCLKASSQISISFLLHLERRHVGAPAFAPVADGRDVHAVQIRMPVIARPRRGHHRSPILQVQRVGKVRLPDLAVLVGGLGSPAAPPTSDTTPAAGASGRRASGGSPAPGDAGAPAAGLHPEFPSAPCPVRVRASPRTSGNKKWWKRGSPRRAAAGASFPMGPSSDQPRPALMASPLKRWKVSMPMPGFTRTSSISFGRTITVSGAAAGMAKRLNEKIQNHLCES